MLKKTIAILLLLLLLCSVAQAGGLPRNEDKFHEGDNVSDAYVDPEK